MDNDQRFEKIEVRLSYLEDYLDTLNSALLRQTKRIDQLEQRLGSVESRFSEEAPEIREIEKPPHY